MSLSRFLCLLLLAFFCAACAGPRYKITPQNEAEARAILLNLSEQNRELVTFKGIGKIRIKDNEGAQSARVAWMVHRPGKIRIEVLSPAGQPTLSMSADGEYFYLFSHTDDTFKKIKSKNPDLKKIVSIPIKAGEVITLLNGRIPLGKYSRTHLRPQGDGWTLYLGKRFGGLDRKIFLDAGKTKAIGMEVLKSDGLVRYRAEFGNYKRLGPYFLPHSLTLKTDNDSEFQLRIRRFIPDAKVSAEGFIIKKEG